MRRAIDGGGPRTPRTYFFDGTWLRDKTPPAGSPYHLSTRLPRNHDIFTGKLRSSSSSAPSSVVWRRNLPRFSPDKNLLPGGCLRGEGKGPPWAARGWPSPDPFSWAPAPVGGQSGLVPRPAPADVAGWWAIFHLILLSGVMGTPFPLR